MKPVLVVDDRSRFPDVDQELSDLVEFHTRFHNRSAVDFSRYESVFVHGRNDAREWVVDSLGDGNEIVFVFSGDEDRVSEFAGVYTLPRPVFTNRFPKFLRRYEAIQDIQESAEVFTVEQSGRKETASSRLSDRDLETVRSDAIRGTVAFYLPEQERPQDEEIRFFPIERRDRDTARSIDFVETLRPLQELDAQQNAPYLIHLREKYLSEGDGLDLLLHLRLEAESAFSRYPVAVDLRRPVEAWVRQHPRHLIAATDGVTVRHPGRPNWADEKPNALSAESHQRILERLPLTEDGLSGRHDLANEWGPIQLWNGLSHLSGDRQEMPGWVQKNYSHLRRRRYYKYLFALLTLRRANAPEKATLVDDQGYRPRKRFAQWQRFLQDRAEPLRVLLIDDEVEEGWENAFRGLFTQIPDQGSVEAPFSESDFENDIQAVRREAVSPKWDLILTDLRLTDADQSTATRTANQLTGVQLIQWIKEERPDRPVVAVTASNKAWTAKSLSTVGADGYWVKENPRHGVNRAYTVDNAAHLLETVQTAVQPHDDARPIWRLMETVEDLIDSREAVRQWVPLTEHQKPEEVRTRLRAVRRRLRRAYGYLVTDFTNHEEAEFSFRRYDLAFLTLWSIVNEIAALHFKDPDFRYKPLHETEGTLRYTFFDPADNQDRAYWIIEDGAVTHADPSAPGELADYIRPTQSSRPDWPSLSAENPRVAWLLHRAGHPGHADRFDELRDLRNDLEEEHGEATQARQADLKDVQDMIRVWRKLLSQ